MLRSFTPLNSNVMATQTVKAILLLSICLSALAVADLNIVKIEGPCDLTDQQRHTAWKNATKAVTEKFPQVSQYCELDITPSIKTFIVIDGVCRTNIACVKTVDGVDIMHGNFAVVVDEATQEFREFYDVPW